MLAIIIPFYKVTFFEKTLQSLVYQSDKRFKVYIGDDASPDDCSSLLEKYSDQFDFEYHRFETNLGGISLTQQWERCIALSNQEKWVMILGDDDVLSENVVAEFYKGQELVKDENINVIKFASILIDEFGKHTSEIYTHPIKEKATDAYYRHFSRVTRSSLSEYVFKSVSFLKNRFTEYPLGWHSDDKAWLDFSDNGFVYTINNSVVYIRVSPQSISGKENNTDLKRKARMLFLKDIILKSNHFSKIQKIDFIFEYELLMNELELVTLTNIGFVFFYFIKLNRLYSAKQFLKRVFLQGRRTNLFKKIPYN